MATKRKRRNPASDYYWRKEGSLWVLRQKRFRGKEHPHDIMAYARTAEEKKQMIRAITGSDADVEENPRVLPRDRWISAKIRVTKSGKIQAKIKR